VHDFVYLLLDDPVELRLNTSIQEDIWKSQHLEEIAEFEHLSEFELEAILD
jgi:hypothetical protein